MPNLLVLIGLVFQLWDLMVKIYRKADLVVQDLPPGSFESFAFLSLLFFVSAEQVLQISWFTFVGTNLLRLLGKS